MPRLLCRAASHGAPRRRDLLVSLETRRRPDASCSHRGSARHASAGNRKGNEGRPGGLPLLRCSSWRDGRRAILARSRQCATHGLRPSPRQAPHSNEARCLVYFAALLHMTPLVGETSWSRWKRGAGPTPRAATADQRDTRRPGTARGMKEGRVASPCCAVLRGVMVDEPSWLVHVSAPHTVSVPALGKHPTRTRQDASSTLLRCFAWRPR